jgi:hypothetical protein
MLTDAQIQKAIEELGIKNANHEHPDCVRIAYEWLDAQKKLKGPRKHGAPLKHIIENWGGRYVSQSDVEVAAYLHPDVVGEYSRYNISARLVKPSTERLKGIGEALTHGQSESYTEDTYQEEE